MSVEMSLARIERFKDEDLTNKVNTIESSLSGCKAEIVNSLLNDHGITHDLMMAAWAVKRASAQIDVVIHAVGVALALPGILQSDEVIESCSLGAGTAASDFDLVTNQRLAEFKFIRWQGGSEAVRKKTLFQDFYKLAREQTPKDKYLYLLNTEIPMRFLRGRSNVHSILSRNRRLHDDFVARFGDTYATVGEFYAAFHQEIQLANLVEVVPGFDAFLDLLAN
jgi:hypothetical protein